jgi:hypothetical protein
MQRSHHAIRWFSLSLSLGLLLGMIGIGSSAGYAAPPAADSRVEFKSSGTEVARGETVQYDLELRNEETSSAVHLVIQVAPQMTILRTSEVCTIAGSRAESDLTIASGERIAMSFWARIENNAPCDDVMTISAQVAGWESDSLEIYVSCPAGGPSPQPSAFDTPTAIPPQPSAFNTPTTAPAPPTAANTPTAAPAQPSAFETPTTAPQASGFLTPTPGGPPQASGFLTPTPGPGGPAPVAPASGGRDAAGWLIVGTLLLVFVGSVAYAVRMGRSA